MPTSGSRPAELLVDTSVAIPLVMPGFEQHRRVSESVGRRRLGLAGHAAFEAYSVLTRLPPAARRPPATVVRLLASAFPGSYFLGAGQAERLLDRLPALGIAGGAIYDAMVGAAAAEAGVPLATRDRRALGTYRALDVELEFIGD